MTEVGPEDAVYLNLLADLREKRSTVSPEIQHIVDRMRGTLVATMRGAIDELGKLKIDAATQPAAESRRTTEMLLLSKIVQAMTGEMQ